MKLNRIARTFALPCLLGLLTGASPLHAADSAPPEIVYIGTFTGHGSKGIYRTHFDPANGTLDQPALVAEAPSPAFLALHPNHHFLYSVNEVDRLNGKPEGGVSAFTVDPANGDLSFLNQQRSAGTSPTHLSVDPDGKNVLVANYGSGAVAVLPIGPDGKLAEPSSVDQHKGRGADASRQEGPHAHCFNSDPDGRFALSCDLGLDKIFVYRLNPAAGTITPNEPPFASVAPASGPRHLAFAPGGKRLYVANEMACTVTAFDYDANAGALKEIQTVSTLPEDFKGDKSSAEVVVHPSGKFLFVSNRGAANNIASFAIDPTSGKLSPIGHTPTKGAAPRYFCLDPAGNFLLAANQDTNNVVVFRIDPATGELHDTGVDVKVPTPVCVLFLSR